MTTPALPSGAENRFELLVQSITDYAIYLLDRDGIVASWNPGAQRFKGYTAEEIIGRHFSLFHTEEDRAAGAPEQALLAAEHEGRFEAAGWRVRKDGTRFWANVVIDPVKNPAGALIGFAMITRDLTERRAAQEELRLSEERFRLLVQSVTDYAIYMLDATGTVVSWNTGAERAKGYTAEEIVGQHFSRFYGEEDRAHGVPEAALKTARTTGRFEAEGWRYRKDGTRFWASVVIDAVRDPAGTLIGYAKVTRDLSERREAQLALEKAQQTFFQSQKMDAIGQLTGGVAHDFNNLLAAVMGSLELAKRRMAGGHDIARFIDNAMQAAERGATLTQRMLAFARKQELKLAWVPVETLVRGMTDLLQRTIGPGIAIETQFPRNLREVRADPGQLELAILNLAVNARDAMGDGGRIVIGAREHELPEADELLPAGIYVSISVSDTGEGMDDETLAHAMEPFYTTKGIGKGTGLGLSMAHGLADQCGGKLTLESRKGHGTTATLWLPAAIDSSDPDRPPASTSSPIERTEVAPMLILAVDDDQLVLMNTVAMLEDLGHHVMQAPSGVEALELMASHPIEMVVTDYAMPTMTGLQLAHRIRSARQGLPILLVSGYADIDRSATLGFSNLGKPFRQADLALAIHDAVRRP